MASYLSLSYLCSEALGRKILHRGLHGTWLLRSTGHPHATVRLEEEHGVLRLAHGFKQHILNLLTNTSKDQTHICHNVQTCVTV
jgi:hypothetical protein